MHKNYLYKTVRSGIFAAIICVSSFLVIPIGAVPVTPAVLTVMLCGVVLTPFEAFCASAVYVIMGAIGFPVFSGGSGGLGVLFGLTGGYIWSYPILSLIVSLFCKIKTKKRCLKYVFAFIGCVTGLIICYFFGTAQYMLVANASFYTALITCVFPFVPIDIFKTVCAVCIGIELSKHLKRTAVA
ncbi:MAG: biotin transporter BioY [Acutalibacteraceae bacterium]|nr:biotin transporter BioY [Acutalibacteraceae bacterium]